MAKSLPLPPEAQAAIDRMNKRSQSSPRRKVKPKLPESPVQTPSSLSVTQELPDDSQPVQTPTASDELDGALQTWNQKASGEADLAVAEQISVVDLGVILSGSHSSSDIKVLRETYPVELLRQAWRSLSQAEQDRLWSLADCSEAQPETEPEQGWYLIEDMAVRLVPMGTAPEVSQVDSQKFKSEETGPDLFSTVSEEPEREALSQTRIPDYVYLNTPDGLEQAIAPYLAAPVLGIDTETTGLDPFTSRVRLLQVAAPDLPVLLLDLFAIGPDRRQPIQSLLAGPAKKVAHNWKFDLKMLSGAEGLTVEGPLFDTFVASRLLAAGIPTASSALDSVVERYLGRSLSKEEQRSDWSRKTLTPDQLAYAALDSSILLPLRDVMKPALIDAGLGEVAGIEFRCVPAVAHMELSGMLLDADKWNSLKVEMEQARDTAGVCLHECLAPGQVSTQLGLLSDSDGINLDSTGQVLEALQALGIPVKSTSKYALKPLIGKYPAIDALLEYRKWSKALSAFGEALPKHINPVTGRIHAEYKQMGTDAGRFSCANPNLQQIPRGKDIRAAFVPAPGNRFAIADYSQMEIRIAAEIAGDQTIIDAYKAGADIHRLTASLVNEVPIEEVTKEQRQAAKAVNFGLIYGMQAEGLKAYAKNSYGVDLSDEQSKRFVKRFFQNYKGLARWHKAVKWDVYQNGATETRTMANRRRQFSGKAYTAFLNTPVQGTGADVAKLALAELYVTLKRDYPAAKIVGCVHDEIIVEAPETQAEAVAGILQGAMVKAGERYLRKCPVEAEASVGVSWADKA